MALVLVVDDEADARRLLAQAIQREGHEVIHAESSDAALAAMAKRTADVVFTDIQMPGRDGRWLTLELRKRYFLTAIVLATSVRDLEPSTTLRFGVLAYLVKPFDLDAVREALRRALAWREERAVAGPEGPEHDQLEAWLDSLEIL